MKCALLVLVLSSALLAGGCGSTKNEPSHYKFVFSHDGDDYEIISVVVSSDGGHNFLTSRDRGRLVLSAKDIDQDGTLDTVLIGDVELGVANDIYVAGIDEARRSGRYREQVSSRIFKYDRPGYTYVVQTFILESGDRYNTLIYFDAAGNEVLCLDSDADGTLDRVTRGTVDLQLSQEFYELVLEEGLRRGRIVVMDDGYSVQPK